MATGKKLILGVVLDGLLLVTGILLIFFLLRYCKVQCSLKQFCLPVTFETAKRNTG